MLLSSCLVLGKHTQLQIFFHLVHGNVLMKLLYAPKLQCNVDVLAMLCSIAALQPNLLYQGVCTCDASCT